MLQQLSATDASFLYMETAETPMHIGSVYLYELPVGYTGDFYEDFKTWIAERMHLSPVFTRKLAQLPFDVDAPLWVRDDNVDLDYHVRRHTLPKPGRFEQLEELAGRLHSNLLDRSRPLWEIYIIDGLADGRVAEMTKFHHAGFDGAAAMTVVKSLYDLTPTPRPVPPAPTPGEKEQLDLINLLGYVYTTPLRQYLRAMQAVPDLLKAWTKLALIDPDTLKLEPPELPPLAPWTHLNVSITGQRSYAARTVSLKDIQRVAKAKGTTVNDVVLALCGGALRRYLRDTKDLPQGSLTAFVPVSVREPGNTEMSTQTIGMICSLATNVADPVRRLRAIHESAQKAKNLTDTLKPAMLGLPTPMGAPLLAYGMMNLLGRYHLAERVRPLANLTISNMIGSPLPLYLAGAKLVANYPISIPTHGSALNITVQSYCDNLDIGVTACRHTVPDVCKLADYIVDAFDNLKAATVRPAAAAAPEKAARRGSRRGAAAKAARAKRPPPVPVAASPPSVERAFPHIATRDGATVVVEPQVPQSTLLGASAAHVLGDHPAAPPSAAANDIVPAKSPEPKK